MIIIVTIGMTLLSMGYYMTQEQADVIYKMRQEHNLKGEEFLVTAYTAGFESTGKHPGDDGYGITTSGEHVEEGTTIACPPNIPFGTKVDIENIGTRVCEDRGQAIQGKHIDLYFNNLSEAQEFGRKHLIVKIKS